MKHAIQATILIGLLGGGAAFAQAPTSSPSTANPAPNASPAAPGPRDSASPAAVSTSDNPRTTAAPVSGANSFTEGQARSRIEEKGFGNVTGLQKDDKGVWRGTAMKDGKSMPVSLDYQGNVVGQ